MNDMAHAVLRLLEENKIDHTLAEHPAVFNMEELYAQGLEHCDAIAKNLLVRDQKKRFYWLLVLYGEKRAESPAGAWGAFLCRGRGAGRSAGPDAGLCHSLWRAE